MFGGDLLFMNRLAVVDSFYLAKINTDENVNPLSILENIQKDILKRLQKLGSSKSFRYDCSDIVQITFMNILQEPLIEYYPSGITIKDDAYLYIIELSGTINYNIGFDKNYDELLNMTSLKTRIIIDKEKNDMATVSKFAASYYLCPFIQKTSEKLNDYLEISYFFDMLKSLVPLNRIVLLDMIKDKVITNLINEILGLNDLGKMLRWKKEKEFRKVQEKIISIVNNYTTIGKLISIEKIKNPDYFVIS
jgi:hypothetical protein